MKNSQPRRRSDKIRRKLSKESQQYFRQAGERLTDLPASHQIKKLAGERFSAQEEMPGNALKRRWRPGWRLLSLALCAFISHTLLNIWRSPQYLIDQIDIMGSQRLNAEEIISALNIQGTHILALDSEKVKANISSAFPELRNIEVRVESPAKISIEVIERQPIIGWQSKKDLIWVDSEGFLIPARGEATIPLVIQSNTLPAYSLQALMDEFSPRKVIRDKAAYLPGIPTINFFSVPKKINDDLLTAILQLNAWMPAEKTLLHQSQRGLGWHDARGWDVFVGQKLEGINDKMVMYQMIVRELELQGINPSLVSVEFLHAPYYRTGE